MTLIVEIESRAPRYVAGLTYQRAILDLLAREGVALPHPWDTVRILPRQPDWNGPHQIALANHGRLLPGVTPPALLRKIEETLRLAMPGQQIAVHPAVDPNLIVDNRAKVRPREPRLAPGELHALLGSP